MKKAVSTAKLSGLLQVVNSSSPERRPVPAMGMCVHRWSFGRASDAIFFNSWVAGALDSAWCAVDQYLALNRSKALRRKFWDKWGPTEFWDEISDDELVRLNQEYLDRHTYNGYT